MFIWRIYIRDHLIDSLNKVRENRRGNREWTIQRHKTQDEDKQNKKTQRRKLKMSNTGLTQKWG